MKTILAIDDEVANLIIVERILEDEYKVVALTSGKQALKYLEKNKPDLILLDILMPEMSGLEVMETLRSKRETADIPVIFLTAQSTPDVESRCFDMGAQDFIAKPFDVRIMLRRVKRTIERTVSLSDADQMREVDRQAKEMTGNGPQTQRVHYIPALKDNTEVRIPAPEIIYVEVYDHVCLIRTDKGEYKNWTTLKNIEEEIGDRFVRAGQSFLVNVDRITSLGDDYILMENPTEIKMPRRSKKELRQQIIEKRNNLKTVHE